MSLRAHSCNMTPRRETWEAGGLTHLNWLRWGLRSIQGEPSPKPTATFQVLHKGRMEANPKAAPLPDSWDSFGLSSPG